MKNLLIILSLILNFSLASQDIPCNELKQQKLPDLSDKTEVFQEMKSKLMSFRNCNLDSIDIGILLEGPILGSIIIEILSAKPDSELTYGEILIQFENFKQAEAYIELKQYFLELSNFMSRVVSIENWEEDKLVLEKIGADPDFLQNFEELLPTLANGKLTYRELDIQAKSNPGLMANISPLVINEEMKPKLWKYKNLDFNSALSKSVELDVPVMMFFTGYGCINAIKMEEEVLARKDVAEKLLNEFVFVPLYVDDKTPIDSSDLTIGRRNLIMQIDKFRNNSQPLFVILDRNGEGKHYIGYVSFDKFWDFLQKK